MPTREELLAVERISAEDLAALLRSSVEPPVIVDVRDEDFATKGHIRDALHLPKEHFEADEDVDALVRRLAGQRELVFHCVRSNTRGPTCALRFMARASALDSPPHVRVLAGGFAGFADKFADDAQLVVPPTEPLDG